MSHFRSIRFHSIRFHSIRFHAISLHAIPRGPEMLWSYLVDAPQRRFPAIVGLLAFSFWIVADLGSASADWPTYRADAARSAYTPQPLPDRLAPAWHFQAEIPSPAWPRSGRLPFDRAHHCVISAGQVYFGCSTDHALYRLDAETGRGEAIFVTDGPIRFAPTVWKDRVFLASDDGFLYCLSLDGELAWKHRGGPSDARRLGNEKLISKWPARGAPVVVDNTVYYAAGIWPTDEIFVHALDCTSGEPKWVNDDSGGLSMSQPHGGAEAESGVSAQGYLVVSGSDATNVPFPPGTSTRQGADAETQRSARLLIPTGRAVPAAFDLESGRFQYFHLQQYGQRGGFATMAVGPMFFNSGIAFDVVSGQAEETLGAGPIAAFPGGLVRATEKQVVAYQWVEQEKPDRRGRVSRSWGLQPLWTVDRVDGGTALMIADRTVVAGGDGCVTLIDLDSGRIRQTLTIQGNAYGLAAANGKLLVSTDRGEILAFADETRVSTDLAMGQVADEGPLWPVNPSVVAAAEEIVAALDSTSGYCLDFGCGDGRLAYELALRTDLQIYAVDDDADQVLQARSRLRAAGVYGSRVTVHHIADLSALPYPNYFANLVVSGRSVSQPEESLSHEGWQASLRPYGGIAVFGPAGQMRRSERGPLERAGQWTHQYMSAANQLCSTDERLQGPLGMLWYRDVDLDLPQRHGRGPAPLFYDGLLYHEGLDELVCVDAYNGTEVWRYPLPGILEAFDGDELMGAAGTGSNYCIGETGVYVRWQDHCLRLDRRSGELLGKFTAPLTPDGEPGTWGYLALEHGQLFGSLANRQHMVTYRFRATTGNLAEQLTESTTLFALDPQTGQLRWRYDAKHSIRHNAIAVGEDTVFLIDRPLADFDRRRDAAEEEHATGVLLALDAATGQQRWRNDQQIDGTTLSLSPEYHRLLMSFQPTRFALASESGQRLTVFSTEDGEMAWTTQSKYASRPMINDYTVYAQGGAWDLLSGEERPFHFSRSYGCGILAGSRYMMVYRSATLGYFDLLKNERTENYGGIRPGCWLNALPAGGLVLVPDASAGCVCSYLNQAWIALEPVAVASPRIAPVGGAFADPVEVHLSHDRADAVIRYTMDGSSPTVDSHAYERPLTVEESVRLRARAFTPDGQVSRASDSDFRIDRHQLPLADEFWSVWDVKDKVSAAPSRWSVDQTVVRQASNIFQGSATSVDPAVERYGTLRIYDSAQAFSDGTIDLEVRSADDDGIGVAFRFEDPNHHYLWATDLQRKFRILAVKDGNDFRVLAINDRSYQKNTWQQVSIVLEGPRITIWIDGQEDMSVTDDRFQHGTIALHSWGSQNVEFRGIRMQPSSDQPPPAIK